MKEEEIFDILREYQVPGIPNYINLTNRERSRLQRLINNALYLYQKIYRRMRHDKPYNYEIALLSALVWAISEIIKTKTAKKNPTKEKRKQPES